MMMMMMMSGAISVIDYRSSTYTLFRNGNYISCLFTQLGSAVHRIPVQKRAGEMAPSIANGNFYRGIHLTKATTLFAAAFLAFPVPVRGKPAQIIP